MKEKYHKDLIYEYDSVDEKILDELIKEEVNVEQWQDLQEMENLLKTCAPELSDDFTTGIMDQIESSEKTKSNKAFYLLASLILLQAIFLVFYVEIMSFDWDLTILTERFDNISLPSLLSNEHSAWGYIFSESLSYAFEILIIIICMVTLAYKTLSEEKHV